MAAEIIKTERFSTFSQKIRIDYYEYRGMHFHETTHIPRFWGKAITSTVVVDIQLPIGSHPCLSPNYYTDEGYGVPVFPTVKQAEKFIDKYKKHGSNKRT